MLDAEIDRLEKEVAKLEGRLERVGTGVAYGIGFGAVYVIMKMAKEWSWPNWVTTVASVAVFFTAFVLAQMEFEGKD